MPPFRSAESFRGRTFMNKTRLIADPSSVFLLLLLTLILLFCGCKNPFKTRSSPPPESREGTWESPALPEIVIENLLNAYNEMIIDNFSECLSDSFLFSAPEDSIDAANLGRPWLFANWNRDAEIKVTENIFKTFGQNPDSAGLVLSLESSPSYQDEEGDTASVLYRHYELVLYGPEGSGPKATLIEGTAAFHMEKTPLGLWSIYFWRELLPAADQQDWADFKANFRQ